MRARDYFFLLPRRRRSLWLYQIDLRSNHQRFCWWSVSHSWLESNSRCEHSALTHSRLGTCHARDFKKFVLQVGWVGLGCCGAGDLGFGRFCEQQINKQAAKARRLGTFLLGWWWWWWSSLICTPSSSQADLVG
jgi:hypothetical protein